MSSPIGVEVVLLSRGGPQGVAGNDGANGADGTNGVDGAQGADGLPGVDGVDGTNGTNGTDGLPGADGADGTNGANGANGTDGVDANAVRQRQVLGEQNTSLNWNHNSGLFGFVTAITNNVTFDAPSNPPVLVLGEYLDCLIEITASGGDYVPIADVIHKNFPTDLILDGATAIIAGRYDGTNYVWGAAVIA